MKRSVVNGLTVLVLSAGTALFLPSARAGSPPSDAVKVIPRVSNPVPPSSQPVSNNIRYEGRSSGPARVHTDANGTRDQSRVANRSTDNGSSSRDRRGDAVCTSGDPRLIGVRCSMSSECDWGARCVGQPPRCANTSAPCASSAECIVPGVCSAESRTLSNRGGSRPARTVPVARNGVASRIPTTVSSGRGINPGVSTR
jgi:hypothetical protein